MGAWQAGGRGGGSGSAPFRPNLYLCRPPKDRACVESLFGNVRVNVYVCVQCADVLCVRVGRRGVLLVCPVQGTAEEVGGTKRKGRWTVAYETLLRWLAQLKVLRAKQGRQGGGGLALFFVLGSTTHNGVGAFTVLRAGVPHVAYGALL